jgi:hypothetical protein
MSEQETPAEILAKINAQLEMGQAQKVRDIQELDASGKEEFQGWSESMGEIIGAVGQQTADAIAELAGNFEAGKLIMKHVGENPDLAKKLSGMTPAAAATKMAQLQIQLMPNAPETTDGVPTWRKNHRSGERYSLGDEVSDAAWEKAFKKRFYTDKSFDRSKFGR